MIRFADENIKTDIRNLWKICFDDSEEFMDLYYEHKYKSENTIVFLDGETVVASLQMLPYRIRFYGTDLPAAYISGACTLPAYRGKGIMANLLKASYKIMIERSIPISFLIPAEDWLYDYYAKYGYTKVFESNTQTFDLKLYLEYYPDRMEEAYRLFNGHFNMQSDICVLKNREDFNVIIKEYILENGPVKKNLSGMARIIDVRKFLGIYAQVNSHIRFSIKITDENLTTNNGIYLIDNGTVCENQTTNFDVDADIGMLTRLLFGFHTDILSDKLATLFPVKTSVMNLMLE